MNYAFQFDAVFESWPLLLEGTWVTIKLSFLSMFFGLIIAIACAAAKINGNALIRFLVNCYIELIRNTPVMMQLFVFFISLPTTGSSCKADQAAPAATRMHT